MAQATRNKAKAKGIASATDKTRTRATEWPCNLPKLSFTASPHAREIKDSKLQADKRNTSKRPSLDPATAFCRLGDGVKAAKAMNVFRKNAKYDNSLIPACQTWYDAPPIPALSLTSFDGYMDTVGVWDPGNNIMFTKDDDEDFLAPPLFVRLPDTYLFEVARRTSINMRSMSWPKDFGNNGEIPRSNTYLTPL